MNNSLENLNKYIEPTKDFLAKYVHLIYFLIVALNAVMSAAWLMG